MARRRGKAVEWLDHKLYSAYGDNWDDARFRAAILPHLNSNVTLLDLGAGAGIVAAMNFKGVVGRVIGVDPDERVSENPYLDDARVGVGERLPCDDASVDVVIADNVLEHLDRPVEVFREIARVLKPDGYFLAKTPNKTHYMPLIARATPHRFHQTVNRWRGREAVDTFPTRYRVNTKRDVEACARAAGLSVESIDLIEGRPEYLRMNAITYLAGTAYERIVNASERLRRFRLVLIATLRKPHA